VLGRAKGWVGEGPFPIKVVARRGIPIDIAALLLAGVNILTVIALMIASRSDAADRPGV
jgi:hypothetical protein